MLSIFEINKEKKLGTDVPSRYRCQYCGNKLTYNITKLGFSIICPVCMVLIPSMSSRNIAIKKGIKDGRIFDLESFAGNGVQMSCVQCDD